MTMTVPDSGSGSPERGTAFPLKGGENEKEFQIIGRRIFLEVSHLMDSIKSVKPFEWYFTKGSASNIIKRTVERLVFDYPIDFPIMDGSPHPQSPQEIIERQRNEAKIQNYINSYSSNPYFDHGFRQIQDFIKGLRPYLDGSGAEPKIDQGNMDGLMTIAKIPLPVIEVIQRRANDPTGYSLVQLAAENCLKKNSRTDIPADEKGRAGIDFGTTFFLQARVDITQAGVDYQVLKKLAQLRPGGRPADWEDKLRGFDKLISSFSNSEKEKPAA